MRPLLLMSYFLVTVTGASLGESYLENMTLVPAGSFVMGDGIVNCGIDEHEVTLTRAFFLGRFEVNNQEYLEMLQYAYDQGYVTATTTEIRDNLDGSDVLLVDLDNDAIEIQFDGAGLDGVLGTVAGDDTILIVAAEGVAGTELLKVLESMGAG